MMERDHRKAIVEFTEDMFSSESTTDGLRKRNETEPSDTLNDTISSEAILRREINLNGALDSKKEDAPSGVILAADCNEISKRSDSAPITFNCAQANGMMRPIYLYADQLKEVNIEVNNCYSVVTGNNTTTIISNPCECIADQHPPCDRALVSDGPATGIDPSFSQASNFDQGKQHSKQKLRKKVRMKSEAKIPVDTRSKVQKRLHSGRFRMATTELVRELDSLEREFQENLLRRWCQSVISYLFGACSDQDNYERIKTLLGSAKEAILTEEDVKKCIVNLLTVLQLSGDDLIEASVLITEVRFVLSVFYAISGKQKPAMEQLTMIQWSSCLGEQKGRIHLQMAETSARIAQEVTGDQEDSKSRVVLEMESKQHFEEALNNCSDKMLSRQVQRATKYACHIGMAKLLLRSDEPLSAGARPSKENLQKAAEHILHLENRSVELSPLRSSQFFLLEAFLHYFNGNYDCAHAYAVKAKRLAEECNFDREHKLADGAISVLSENMPQKFCEAVDIPNLIPDFENYRDLAESSSTGNESDTAPQDCNEQMNLTDTSDSD